jgi:hypothetical protein
VVRREIDEPASRDAVSSQALWVINRVQRDCLAVVLENPIPTPDVIVKYLAKAPSGRQPEGPYQVKIVDRKIKVSPVGSLPRCVGGVEKEDA